MKFIYNLLLILTLALTGYGIISTASSVYAHADDVHKTSCACPTPTPTLTPTPNPTPSETPMPSASPAPSFTPSPIPTPSPSQTPTPTSVSTPTPSVITPSPTAAPGITSNDQGGSSGGVGGSSTLCTAANPGKATLLSVTSQGSDKAQLKWTKLAQATTYAISYGTKPLNYTYGVTSTGNTDNTIIGGFLPNQRYCFAMTAINDCNAGPISNEICIGASYDGAVLGTNIDGGDVLGLSFTGTGDQGKDAKVDSSLPDTKLVINPAEFLNTVKVINAPSRITIPALNIDLPVSEAKAEDGFWQTFTAVASHGISSASPGEGSNVVIFAHNRWQVLGNLKFAQIGQKVVLTTKNGKFGYLVSEIKQVAPDDLEIIAKTSDETLTLYTCSGENDSKRLVVIAKPL